jgi:hypothetical protein
VLGGAVAGAVSKIGPDWSLRVAFVIYVGGTVLAIMLPARVDSSLGEEDIEKTVEVPVTDPRGGPLRRIRRRVDALPWRVLFALWFTAGTRLLAGFLTLFLVFLMRENPLVLALVVGAAGLGNAVGSVVGPLFKGRAPETIAAATLLVATLTAVATAVFYSEWTLVALGLVTGLSGQLAKLSLDAVIQEDVSETVRTSVFARSETTLQTAWVLGGGLGIALPLIPQLGFGVIAVLLGGTFVMAIRSRIARHQQSTTLAPPVRR